MQLLCSQIPFNEGKESAAMKELFKVLKDHKNPLIQELVNLSYENCFRNEVERMLGEEDLLDSQQCGTENVARVWLINSSFSTALQAAVAKLQEAKLQIDRFGLKDGIRKTMHPDEEARLSDKLTVLVNDIGIAMKKMEYALFRGKIYKKVPAAKFTYAYKCEMRAFVNCLAANDFFKARLLRDMKKVIEILGDPDCEVIRPIFIDYNLIEVDAGYCWSVKDRHFLENPIPDEKIGMVTPRAFSTYDSKKGPEPKYFREILENSLSDGEIAEFCEDYLKLLNFNQKRHKDRVPCLIGDANSGKTSLFHPILGLIHHSNVATITKQRVFNKAMITKSTEVIFIDEASTSTMDIDDWKILTQGGFTACDIKYQTARSFINRCPMFLTAQQKLQFKPEDQPAMERRLRNYTFKSLATPKNRASEWLRKHPMDCIVWAAGKAHKPGDEEETSDGTEEDQDSQAEHLDGTLPEFDKEALRTMSFTDVLPPAVDSPPHEEENETVMSVDSAEEAVVEQQSSNDILENLKRNMSVTQPHSLRYRQLEHMLKDQERKRDIEENDKRVRHEGRKEMLRNRGVSTQNIELLPADPYESMPSPILKDLEKYDEEQRRLEERRRRDRACQVFEGEWLMSTERELHECVLNLTRERDQYMRANLQAYQELLCEKLKQHHSNLGTYNTAEALEERRRVCIEHGLLRKEDQMLVKNLLQPMPQPELTPQGDSTDEEELFQTQDPSGSNQLLASAVPSSVPDDIAISEELLMMHGTKRRREDQSRIEDRNTKRQNTTLLSYFRKRK